MNFRRYSLSMRTLISAQEMPFYGDNSGITDCGTKGGSGCSSHDVCTLNAETAAGVLPVSLRKSLEGQNSSLTSIALVLGCAVGTLRLDGFWILKKILEHGKILLVLG